MFAAYAQGEPCIPVNDVPPPPHSFLSRPPQQKKRPTQGLPLPPSGIPPSPSRRRSNTVTAIANWAQQVQPGSPPPQSPRSSVSSTRRPSITRGRRPSIASAFGFRVIPEYPRHSVHAEDYPFYQGFQSRPDRCRVHFRIRPAIWSSFILSCIAQDVQKFIPRNYR